MRELKSVRPLDAVIAVVAVIVVLLGAYLGYSVWSQNRSLRAATPAARAVEEVTAEVRKNPNDLDARMRLAQALSVAGRDNDAIKQYEQILKVNKQFVPAISGIGFIALKRQDWAEGERYYRKIVDMLEGNVDETKDAQLEIAYFYLGTALSEQKDYEEAANYYLRALRIRRDASDTHYQLAVAFREMGKEGRYKEALENALLFDPKMAEANYDYAELLLKEGDVAGAAEHFRASADAAPAVDKPAAALEKLGSAEGHFTKAQKLAATDIKKALIEARVAAALEPRSVPKLLFLAELYMKNKNKEDAATVYQRVLAIDAQNAEALAGLKGAQK